MRLRIHRFLKYSERPRSTPVRRAIMSTSTFPPPPTSSVDWTKPDASKFQEGRRAFSLARGCGTDFLPQADHSSKQSMAMLSRHTTNPPGNGRHSNSSPTHTCESTDLPLASTTANKCSKVSKLFARPEHPAPLRYSDQTATPCDFSTPLASSTCPTSLPRSLSRPVAQPLR